MNVSLMYSVCSVNILCIYCGFICLRDNLKTVQVCTQCNAASNQMDSKHAVITIFSRTIFSTLADLVGWTTTYYCITGGLGHRAQHSCGAFIPSSETGEVLPDMIHVHRRTGVNYSSIR